MENNLPETFSVSDCETWMTGNCPGEVLCENCPLLDLRNRDEEE